MVVDDDDIVGIPISPVKADAPLVVDPYAVLVGATPLEFLESVPWWHTQIDQRFGRVDDDQFPEHEPPELGRKAPDGLAIEESRGVTIPKTLDHVQ